MITTRSSASASELVINSLRPYMPVTIIGDTTYGKPVGQYGLRFCDKVLYPVAFSIKNANLEGDFFDGLAVDCAAGDDYTHQLGDRAEASFAEALTFIRTGACSAAQRRREARALRMPQSIFRAHRLARSTLSRPPQRDSACLNSLTSSSTCMRCRSRIVGQRLERIRLASPFLVRSFDPPIDHANGKTVVGLRRLGKRWCGSMDDDLFLVIHLMIAGRFKFGLRRAGAQRFRARSVSPHSIFRTDR